MKLSIKNYRTCAGIEDEAFSCTLYIDGKRAALVAYDGWGGPYTYDFTPSDKRAVGGATYSRFNKFVGSLPPVQTQWDDSPLPQSMDMVVESAINDMLESQQIKRLCKSNRATVCRLAGDRQGQWRVYSAPFSATSVREIRRSLGSDDVEFANVRFFGDPA